MYPAILSFAIGMVLLSQAHHGLTLLLSAVFVGLGYGTTQSSAQALAIKRSPAHRIGLATSTFIFSWMWASVSAPLYSAS